MPAGIANMPTKHEVLSKVTSVLDAAGLNDRVHSLRDCDSTLFVLVWKKLFLTKLPGLLKDAVEPEEHMTNYSALLQAAPRTACIAAPLPDCAAPRWLSACDDSFPFVALTLASRRRSRKT